MIDLGLSKIALIGVVALVVIGPEKLPRVARMAGSLFGRAQRYISDIKSEVSREIELDELRKMQQEMQDAANNVEQSISQNMAQTEKDLSAAWGSEKSLDASYNDPLREPPTPGQLATKAKDFRKKKLSRTSGIPSWYKRQSGHRSRVTSGAARVARYSPSSGRSTSRFFH
jgi:sec-independent protein translocase protein TatB